MGWEIAISLQNEGFMRTCTTANSKIPVSQTQWQVLSSSTNLLWCRKKWVWEWGEPQEGWKLNKRGEQSKSACQILWLDLPTNQEWWWQIPLVTAQISLCCNIPNQPREYFRFNHVWLFNGSVSAQVWTMNIIFCSGNPPVLLDTLKYKLYWEARHLKHVLPNYRNISF